MPQISVPSDFFSGELRVYGDWRTAFARELLQNATDARPSRIDISFSNVTTDTGTHGRVTFTDDGHGMSRQVLEDVFFALGRTTKTDGDSIGGFGRARIIICFAQKSYTLRTGNLLVNGCGGEYTITETTDRIRGCEFTIDLIDETYDRVRDAFTRLLDSCAITIPVYVDGNRFHTQPRPDRATRVLRDSSGSAWAKVYATGNGYGVIQVRVHGLLMFHRYVNGNDNVILELEPSRARDVLAASRDNLHTVYGDQLDKFMADLAQNRRKALRPPAQPLDLHVGGGGFLVSDAVRPAACETPTEDVITPDGNVLTLPASTPQQGVTVRPANQAAYTNLAAGIGVSDGLFAVDEPQVPDLGFDVFLLAESNDARVRRLTKQWNPAGWDHRTGARRRALLLTWKAAVGYCVDVLLKQKPHLERVAWTVGWTFDTDVEAVHKGSENGHVLALNPVFDDGSRKYSVSARKDRMKLLAIAAHEVTHIIEGDHNEAFASHLTDLFGALDPIVADRILRDASRNG